ncbi:STAS domain-containing protein [Streptacidiphilus neutrinimicus]|uniref:STAS domain-containing protein n=1 Tax=Streptacidiphilus neutrinimicus TaxID=105420 RepID=UPI0007C6A1E2|nr:STAS domain-containing protein [Streptacidiphilus neutrinimicus]
MGGEFSRVPPSCRPGMVDDVLVFHLAGDLDADAHEAFAAMDLPLARFHAVVVDLAQVTFFSSATLNALLSLRLRAEPAGVPVHLCGVGAPAARVLEITGADRLFPRHDDLTTALMSLSPVPPAS